MTEREIMEHAKLPAAERHNCCRGDSLRSIREELGSDRKSRVADTDREAGCRGQGLVARLRPRRDLTSFMALDGEDFHAS